MKQINFAGLAAALGLLLACNCAQAQLYHYKDAQGHMVYSDTPPPPDTPPSSILKAPKMSQSAPAPTPAATASTGSDKDKKDKKGPQSVADREADYKKRMADADKKSKDDAAKSQAAAQDKERCQQLQSNLASLQSGQRIRKTDADGNPYFIDDDQRAADVAKAQQDISSSKCGA